MATKFIQQSLGKDENIVHEIPQHWVVWLRFWIMVLLAPVTLGISLIIAIIILIKNKTTERAITSRRVLQKTGFISRTTQEMKLSVTETIEIDQGIIGRILGFGTLKVTGRGNSVVIIANTPNPMHYKREMDDASDTAN